MRLGVDLGGTKIEIIAIDLHGRECVRERVRTPASGYDEIVAAIRDIVLAVEANLGCCGTVGIAIPGTLSPRTGLVKNANTTALNGRPLDADLGCALRRQVRIANDANCFTLSEATDGAAANCEIVFGVIAGTGVGGGICVRGRLIGGAHLIAGEWGHNPLPSPNAAELPGPICYCGRRGCIETWISGPALAREFARHTGSPLPPAAIAQAAIDGDKCAKAAMSQYIDRFARSVASVVNLLDPDAIVLGGGLSNIAMLAGELPRRVESYSFSSESPTRIVTNLHGDSSGVRGAAWLWSDEEESAGLPR